MSPLRRSARVARQAPDTKRAASDSDAAPPSKKTKTQPDTSAKPDDAVLEKPRGQTKTAELEVGDAMPNLTLEDQSGAKVDLAEAAKSAKYVVIFAYPKASTPGCTRQAKGFQKNHGRLRELDAVVFGLLADSPKAQLNFVTKQGLEYRLLLDPARALIGALGARKSPSGVKRSHWIFSDGKLAVKRVQIGPEASIDGALAEVEELARAETGLA